MYWIIFINEQGTRVEIKLDDYKEWKKRVKRMQKSKKVTYIGSGES